MRRTSTTCQAPPPTTTLFAFRSRPLAESCRPLLKESINLYGEALMRLNAAPRVRFRPTMRPWPVSARGAAAWGIAADARQLIDGSGLSRRDAITPDALLVVLRRITIDRTRRHRCGHAHCRCRRVARTG